MMTLIAILLSIISIYLIVHIWTIDIEFRQKERVNNKLHYHIPAVFWSDYNKILLKIYKCNGDENGSIKYAIEEFEHKYQQLIDLKTYNECVSIIYSNYKNKTK